MTKWIRTLAVMLALAMLAVACGDGTADTTEGGASDTTEAPGTDTTEGGSDTTMGEDDGGMYRIGYSNGGGVGNGFREE